MVSHIAAEDDRVQDGERAVSRPLNPYIVGPPVGHSQAFTGREDLIAQIEALLLSDPGSVVFLYGQRRMGMTSLLLQLSHRLSDRFSPVYFDSMGLIPRDDSNVFRQLVFAIAESLDLLMPDMVNAGENYAPVFVRWMGEISKRLRGRPLVLLFDDCEYLDRMLADERIKADLLQALRATAQYNVAMLFVFHSHIDELSLEWIRFFGKAHVVRLSYLAQEAARRLIAEPAAGMLDYDSEAVNQIIRETGGHPYFLQLVCFVVFNIAIEKGIRRVSVDIVQDALQSSLEAGAAALALMWDGIDHGGRTILIQIALGNSTPTGSYEALDRLLRQEILEESNGVYRFQVPLFQRWVAQQAKTEQV